MGLTASGRNSGLSTRPLQVDSEALGLEANDAATASVSSLRIADALRSMLNSGILKPYNATQAESG
jgi:hypothetical protein